MAADFLSVDIIQNNIAFLSVGREFYRDAGDPSRGRVGKRIADLIGGNDALFVKAKAAFEQADYQWAAQLCDHLLALSPAAKEPKLLKADALEAIAQNVLSGIGRNYYLTVAQELRQEAAKYK